jgi:hypothetical protein
MSIAKQRLSKVISAAMNTHNNNNNRTTGGSSVFYAVWAESFE